VLVISPVKIVLMPLQHLALNVILTQLTEKGLEQHALVNNFSLKTMRKFVNLVIILAIVAMAQILRIVSLAALLMIDFYLVLIVYAKMVLSMMDFWLNAPLVIIVAKM
jgi:hypothetical protein